MEEGCFLLDALESRVHFERLCDCLADFVIDLVTPETASKEEAEETEVGKESSSSQRPHSKVRVKQGRPLQEWKVWFVFVGRCFLLDALESRVHFEHLNDCHSGFGSDVESDVVGPETASKRKQRKRGWERKKQQSACAFQRADQGKVVRYRNARCGLFCKGRCFLPDALESRVHFERLGDCLSAFVAKVVPFETARKGKQREKRLGREEAKVSVRIPKERIKQGRPLQECKVWFVCGGKVFLTGWFGGSCSL